MPCIARKYLLIRTATYFSKALIFGYFLIKQKVREKKYFHPIQKNNQYYLKSQASRFVSITSK